MCLSLAASEKSGDFLFTAAVCWNYAKMPAFRIQMSLNLRNLILPGLSKLVYSGYSQTVYFV